MKWFNTRGYIPHPIKGRGDLMKWFNHKFIHVAILVGFVSNMLQLHEYVVALSRTKTL
jgi:hypothetical protein